MQLARSVEEWDALCSRGQDSPFVHDKSAWDACVSKRDGVLGELSDEAIEEISKTIEFSQGGLAHFTYEKAGRELGKTQIDRIFELFGIGRTLATSYKDHYCKKKGTCSSKLFRICTSNC